MLAELIRTDFSLMPGTFWMRWAIFLLLLLLMIVWHVLHNHHTLSLRSPTTKDFTMLKRVALLRSLGIIGLSVTCFFILMLTDAQQIATPSSILTANSPSPTDNANALPPIDETTLKEALAVYAEDKLDSIKARYEDNFVSYLYLRRCKQIKEEDYTIILNALKNELAQAHITYDPTKEIYSAAQGSYDLLYSESSCTPDTMTPVLQGYNTAIASMKAAQSQP